MVQIDLDKFDDELQSMHELMAEEPFRLTAGSLKAPIGSLRLKKAVVVELGTPLIKCIELLLARHIGCLIVVEGEKTVGIFTERDVLLKLPGENIDMENSPIDDFMTRNPKTLLMTDSIAAALRLMHEGKYRHVIIVNAEKRPISLVSIKDIVSYIVEFFPQDVLNLPPHPIRIGTKNREGG